MDVAVFDADVLIAYLDSQDANNAKAVERMRQALKPDTRRLVSAVNYCEVLIGPLRHAGPAGADTVDAMLVRLGIETIQVDLALARRAAAVRVRTGLKLPDAYTPPCIRSRPRSGSASSADSDRLAGNHRSVCTTPS